MEVSAQQIFSKDQLEQLRRLIDKDPTLFTEVTGKKVPGRKLGQKNPPGPKAKLELVQIPPHPKAGELVTEEVVVQKKKRITKPMSDEEKAAFAAKMRAAREAKLAGLSPADKKPPKPKLTKAEKLEQKLIAEAAVKGCYVKKTIPKIETVVIGQKPRPAPPKPKVEKSRRVVRDDTDDDSEEELSMPSESESEVSDGRRTLRKIKKTVAAIKQADVAIAQTRFQPMAPQMQMKYNPWGR